ncbi:hypothetical protein PIB30_090564 [Stylosanthes scabra]|uniref:Uncharacterized protein n=1 Tax=Stylosanthes scabra TaxID=79078 RepID=A0ABU6WX47_9FABA|nr:hypothetical protein [Stylosanthes scabra]
MWLEEWFRLSESESLGLNLRAASNLQTGTESKEPVLNLISIDSGPARVDSFLLELCKEWIESTRGSLESIHIPLETSKVLYPYSNYALIDYYRYVYKSEMVALKCKTSPE